jgi:Zn-finger nucleic acid-binding protein
MLDHAAFAHVRDHAYRRIVERMGGGWIDVPIADRSAALACPKCTNPMMRTSLDEIPLDFCHDDGIWFDHQELMAVATALSRARPSERPGVHGDGAPYARTPEVAERLAELQAELRSQVTRTATTAAIARLKRLRFGRTF